VAGVLLWRRRLDAIGVFAIVCFAIGLLLVVATGVIGVILLVHALVMVALALTSSTTIFLALRLPLSLAIVGGGLAALVWWIRHQYPSRWNRPPTTGLPNLRDQARQHEPGSSAERHDLPPMGGNAHPHRQGKRDKRAHRHDPQNRHHQRADRRGVARRAG
jgi:hypothetical protein